MLVAEIGKDLDDGRAVVKEMYPMLFSGQLTVVEIEKELIVLQVGKGSAPEIPDQEFFSLCYYCCYVTVEAIEKALGDDQVEVKEMYPMLFSEQLIAAEIEMELIAWQVVGKVSELAVPDQKSLFHRYRSCFGNAEGIARVHSVDQVEVKERYPMLFLDQLKQSVAEIERVLLHVPDYSSTLACSLPEVLVVLRVVMELFDYQ